MPNAPALARPSPGVSSRIRNVSAIVTALVVAAGLLVAVSSQLADDVRVDLLVENPTAYPVNVDVRSADGSGGRLGLGTVSPTADQSFTSVIDQGDRWVFEFSYAGVEAGSIELVRNAAVGGPVVIPDSVERTLRDAGLSAPPS